MRRGRFVSQISAMAKPAPASSHIARHIVQPPASTNAAPAVFTVLIKFTGNNLTFPI